MKFPFKKKTVAPPSQPTSSEGVRALLPDVQQIIAISSGKGGVGKSTTAVNLALACAAMGLKVGLLDADIHGPSVPMLLKLTDPPRMDAQKRLIPLKAYGIQALSIGCVSAPDAPIVWRGAMVMSAILQLVRDVDWGYLDVLLIDMPPGTGDAHLTLAQNLPLAGTVVVSTPQDLALLDARRGIKMFERVHVPILGLIENMSFFICPSCGSRSDIFGHGGAQEEALRLGVPFLGEIPLDPALRRASDGGEPIMVSDPSGVHAAAYLAIAGHMLERARHARKPAPRIVIES